MRGLAFLQPPAGSRSPATTNPHGFDMSFRHEMRGLGFEPRKALSYQVLSLTHLTTLASPLRKTSFNGYKKVLIVKN